MTVGIVQELAQFQFGVDVILTQLALQGEGDAEFTTWRITATDPSQRWKLSPTVDMDDVMDLSQMELPEICPYSGRDFLQCCHFHSILGSQLENMWRRKSQPVANEEQTIESYPYVEPTRRDVVLVVALLRTYY